MTQKICTYILLVISVSTIHYEILANILPCLIDDPHSISLMAAQLSTLLLPILTSFIIKGICRKLFYVMFCYSFIAVGDYLHAFLYSALLNFSGIADESFQFYSLMLYLFVIILKTFSAVFAYHKSEQNIFN